MNIHQKRWPGRLGAILAATAVLVSAAIVTSGASARQAAAPQSTSQPTIAGQVREGRTVSARNGNWNNSPTGFAYQWQQCDSTGAGCNPISGATSKTYTVATADVDHTLKVAVTATNADGSSTSTSQASSVVSSSKAPVSTASPSITGTAKVGEQLTVSTGTWTGGVKSFSYQWQVCDSSGNSCSAVQDATAKTYGVRTADTGKTIRVVVTATNLAGSTNATTSPTSVVTNGSAPAPVTRNHAPTIAFRSLARIGHRIYARFTLCDDGTKNVTVIEHDVMAGRLGYTRRFSIAPRPCGTHAKNWMLIPRFRRTGKFTVTLRAVDKSGASSRTVSRTLRFHAV
ncbi:MAG TPA: hypothetical protein VG265_13760 [Gaiellaceae bacterium]|nr:hypothetical protein [Gaiellaceae bacterium]